MFLKIAKELSQLFDVTSDKKKPEEEDAPAVLQGVMHGAVVVLPAATYAASDLKNLITTSGGKDEEPAYWRIISNQCAWEAVEKGTDRTSHSTVHTLRGDNTTMAEHGITDAGAVTYLHRMEDGIPEQPQDKSILVYGGKGIRNITTNSPNVPFPNNSFYHFTDNPRAALLAVITSEPIPKAQPAAPSPAARGVEFTP